MATQPIRSTFARVPAGNRQGGDGPSDGRLLTRFVESRADGAEGFTREAEEAFAALVARFGPLVLGVCRRTVGDAHLAEDAFQAAFLVLARKADAVRPADQVGAWMYGVAYRIARRVRASHARRLAQEQSVPTFTQPAAPVHAQPDDLTPILDEELARLPDHYRAVVLLCDLQGQPRRAAAARLGIPDGTLSNRLTAARRMLARRLTRRGVTLGAGGVAGVLAASGSARVSAALAGATIRVAGGAGAARTAVTALADGELKMLLFTKLKGLAVGLLAAVVGVGLAGAAVPVAAGNDPRPAVRVAKKPGTTSPAPQAPKVIDNDGPFDEVAFSPDGKLVATLSRIIDENDQFKTVRVIRVWDVATGKVVKTLFEGRIASGVAFSPDGKRVATTQVLFDPTKNKPGDVRGAFSTEVLVFEVATGKLVATLTGFGAQCPYHVAFSPDGKSIAAGGGLITATSVPAEGEVTVWDVATEKVLWTSQDHTGAVRRVAFSPDSKRLATPADDKTVRVWDAFTGKHQLTITLKDEESGIYSAAFSPDGKLVAAGTAAAVHVWDATTGVELHTMTGNKLGSMSFIRFLPDGTLITAGTTEKADGNLKLWDAKTGKLIRTIPDPNLTVRSLDVTADGKSAVVGLWERTLIVVPLGK